jgi:hypothetical protein
MIMGDTHYGNAMTEIALALAMAFFSIMVLAMVSMSASTSKDMSKTIMTSHITAKLAPAKPETPLPAQLKAQSTDTLLIYSGGQFYDRDLQAVDLKKTSFSGRVILAIDPALAMGDALSARAQVKTDDLTITILDQRWTRSLKQHRTQE